MGEDLVVISFSIGSASVWVWVCVLTLETCAPMIGDRHAGPRIVIHGCSLVGVDDLDVLLLIGSHCGVWTSKFHL